MPSDVVAMLHTAATLFDDEGSPPYRYRINR
jgi:hypothetical protein